MRRTHALFTTTVLTIASATAQDGTFIKSGSGCPRFDSAFNAAPHAILPDDGWNLDGRSYTFSPAGSDWFVVEAGSWIAPSPSASVIGPSDDIVIANLPLGFTFPFVGGSGTTQFIDVAPNGYIYLDSGTNTATRCCNAAAGIGNFLSATPSVAVLGTDLDSTTGGQILFETILVGMNSVAIVTWEDVPEWPRNGLNTVQGQLWDNGNIVISHLRTSGQRTLDTALVGVSAGGVAPNPGAVEFNPSIGLTIDAFPNIGTTVTVTADHLPGGATFGELQFGGGQTVAPLSGIGAPVGCDLLVSPIFFGIGMAVTPPTASVSLPIANSPSTLGISFELQAIIADLTQIGTFNVPVFLSDRATLTVGQLSNNDECIGAIPITDGVTLGDNLTATTSAVTGTCTNMGVDVWYQYFPTCTGMATFSFCSTNGSADYDTVLAVFDGSCGNLTEIDCNDDFCGLMSEVTVPVTIGVPVYVAAGGWVSTLTGPRQGTFALEVTCQ